jgi:glyoxylase-like metal-dependent hydrolase (beta-lactamase superfamily II)
MTGVPADGDARVIDLMHLGEPRVIAAWVVGDVIIDCGPSSTLPTLLDALGDWRPSAILLTHIHFDHAGGAGTLVRRWPDVKVYVHERGYKHLADPERLYSSAQRLYGDDMERLWGEMVAIPEANLEMLHGGETIHDGVFEVAYTPGHASHHVSFLRDGTAYVGDVGGVRITGEGIAIPPTPPPDIDVEKWHQSIATVRAWEPERLAMTHFGAIADVTSHLDALERRLDSWSTLARDGGRDRFLAEVHAEIQREGSPDQAAKYEQAAPVEQLYLGYERYWAKRAERAS